MNQFKITIITPTFNRAHTLTRVYESLKRQTFKDFKWLIMDDGSTDGTPELIDEFNSEKIINIEYHHNQNAKKFYTIFKGVEKVETDYFTVMDSDDSYTDNALEILINEAEKLDKSKFISVIGHSQDENGKIYGTLFPNDGFDGSILEMRYKHKVEGDKNGIFITKPYQKYLKEFDYESYKGEYAPQKIFFNIYDGNGMKTRFINKVIRNYYYDLSDAASMSNERVKPSSYLGLCQGHLSFLNSYGEKLWKYPIPLLRNIFGYSVYSFALHHKFTQIFRGIKRLDFKLLFLLLFPASYIYSKVKLS